MGRLSPDTIEMLAMCGIVCLAGILIVIFCALYTQVKEEIIYRYERYKDKHRMDKPPECKCYCTQCECWQTSNPTRELGLCTVWNVWTAHYETCSRGSLRTKEGYRNEELRKKTNPAT